MSPTKLHISSIIDDKRCLETHVTEDAEATVIVLDSAVAGVGVGIGRTIAHVLSGNSNSGAFDAKREVWQRCTTGEGVAREILIVRSSIDLGPVILGQVIRHDEQAGTRIGNAIDAVAVEVVGSDLVASGSESPVSLATIGSSVGDVSSILVAVNVAKVVCTIYRVIMSAKVITSKVKS